MFANVRIVSEKPNYEFKFSRRARTHAALPKKPVCIKMRKLLQHCVLIGKQIAAWAALFMLKLKHSFPFKIINQTAIHHNA